MFFDISDPFLVEFKKVAKLEHEPLGICFDDAANIWAVLKEGQNTQILLKSHNYDPTPSTLNSDINKLKNESLIELNFYETGQLRKWSNWSPNQINEKRSAEVSQKTSNKKTKRGGVKQKEKKALKEAENADSVVSPTEMN